MTGEQFNILNEKLDIVIAQMKPASTAEILAGFVNTGRPMESKPVADPEPGVTEWFRGLFHEIGMIMPLGNWGTWEIRKEAEQPFIHWLYDKLVSKEGSQYSGYAIIGPYADLRDIEDPYHEIDWFLQEKFGRNWKIDFEPLKAPGPWVRSGVLYDRMWGCRANIRQRSHDAPRTAND